MEEKIPIREIQKSILFVFKKFKKICEEQGFRYFAIGGTCIGAVRHQGFIPWDDDLDVAMPVEDYFAFLDYCKENLKLPFGIIDPIGVRHYTAIYVKMQNITTTYVEDFVKGYPDRYTGVFIDIFPVCGLPKDEKQRNKAIKRIDFFRKLNLKLRFPISEEGSMKGRVNWLLISPLRMLKPYYWATKQQLNIIKKYRFGLSEYILFPWRFIPGTAYSRHYQNQLFYEDFKETIEVKFEDTKISIPKGYDRYLSMDFGDYMLPPPQEQREGCHPVHIVDLKKSYLDYLKEQNSLSEGKE